MSSGFKSSPLIIIGSLDRGGCEIHLLNVLPSLRDEGFEPEVFTLARPGELAGAMREAGVPVHKPWFEYPRFSKSLVLRGARMMVIAFQLWIHLLRHRPAVIHFFLPMSYILGSPVAIMAGIRNRVMSRRSLNDYQMKKPKLLARIEKWLHQHTTLILGNSRQVVRQLVHEEGAPEDRTLLLYNGIKVMPRQPGSERMAVRDRLHLSSSSLVMACVANLIPYKGHMDLMAALGLVKSNLPEDWKLLVVGRDDGIGIDLKHKAEEVGIVANVEFLGNRSDVADLLRSSDIGLLCSHEEGFSNAILEGMAAALPMIVTDVGGNAEAVVHNETGLVVPAHSPNALADAIVKMAGDPVLRHQMGEAGRQRVEKYFGMEECVRKYACVYNTLLKKSPVEDLVSDRRFHY